MTNLDLPSRSVMYSALAKRDTEFEGVFFFAVKTTGVFCRPTCSARTPKPENIEYYALTKQALNAGYRPCKVCHPMEMVGQPPEWLKSVLDDIHKDPSLPIRDSDLRQRGIDPVCARRWFQKNHNMTFHAYIRTIRLNKAFTEIKKHGNVTYSAMDSGYDSNSGFHAAFKKAIGFSPSRSHQKNIITISRIPSPLGPLIAGVVDEGVCLLEFADRKNIEQQFSKLCHLLGAGMVGGEHVHLSELQTQLCEYFESKRLEFNIPLVIPGTPFQREVWQTLIKIPYGHIYSYQQQATTLGKPNAIRAVASANANNRIAILIPCHRVKAKSGGLAGYAGGVWRKQYLLNLEQSKLLDS